MKDGSMDSKKKNIVGCIRVSGRVLLLPKPLPSIELWLSNLSRPRVRCVFVNPGGVYRRRGLG